MKVGPHATSHVESRQARKGATVRRSARVPWEYLTGAGSTWRSRDGRFDGGCTVIFVPRGSERRSSLGLPTALYRSRGVPLLRRAPPPLRARARRVCCELSGAGAEVAAAGVRGCG